MIIVIVLYDVSVQKVTEAAGQRPVSVIYDYDALGDDDLRRAARHGSGPLTGTDGVVAESQEPELACVKVPWVCTTRLFTPIRVRTWADGRGGRFEEEKNVPWLLSSVAGEKGMSGGADGTKTST